MQQSRAANLFGIKHKYGINMEWKTSCRMYIYIWNFSLCTYVQHTVYTAFSGSVCRYTGCSELMFFAQVLSLTLWFKCSSEWWPVESNSSCVWLFWSTLLCNAYLTEEAGKGCVQGVMHLKWCCLTLNMYKSKMEDKYFFLQSWKLLHKDELAHFVSVN